MVREPDRQAVFAGFEYHIGGHGEVAGEKEFQQLRNAAVHHRVPTVRQQQVGIAAQQKEQVVAASANTKKLAPNTER